MAQPFNREIVREVTFPSVAKGLKARTWRFRIGSRGITAWPAGEKDRARSLTWKDVVSLAIIYGKGEL